MRIVLGVKKRETWSASMFVVNSHINMSKRLGQVHQQKQKRRELLTFSCQPSQSVVGHKSLLLKQVRILTHKTFFKNESIKQNDKGPFNFNSTLVHYFIQSSSPEWSPFVESREKEVNWLSSRVYLPHCLHFVSLSILLLLLYYMRIWTSRKGNFILFFCLHSSFIPLQCSSIKKIFYTFAHIKM